MKQNNARLHRFIQIPYSWIWGEGVGKVGGREGAERKGEGGRKREGEVKPRTKILATALNTGSNTLTKIADRVTHFHLCCVDSRQRRLATGSVR